ncbi:nuclear transport factor 2 family protein [Flagellimonas sp. HMM57]|uniref:nuclear transport factor 2 family protein n=1 Tax=unclassified Flagellimonas TaxID=2644544 RepID=UPI0013D1D177|nr:MULTISPECIES: nuclear transport factor 2 family protein [unclassified Flagellimonas]UII75746.1 nuclear transport factor 2 family protein [Flagellimonas sp. HMM57]
MRYSILCFFLIAGFVNGQNSDRAISEELLDSIKTEIWIPFMESYAYLDSDKLKSIHSDEIVRITLDQNNIQTGQDYLENFSGYIDDVKQQGGGLDISFVILSTAINETEDIAYQTGYYRFSSKQKGEKDLSIRGYGKFHVTLKKEEGLWKLVLDSDKRIQLSHNEFNGQKTIYKLER